MIIDDEKKLFSSYKKSVFFSIVSQISFHIHLSDWIYTVIIRVHLYLLRVSPSVVISLLDELNQGN